MSEFCAVILAAGQGTRMRSAMPKVLHTVCGLPMVHHVVACATQAGATRVLTVVGHEGKAVSDYLKNMDSPVDITPIEQKDQLGTGHAVLTCEKALAKFDGVVVILNGDVPLVTPALLDGLLSAHGVGGGGVTLTAVELDDPTGYGRVIRDDDGALSIVEESDATPVEKAVHEVNAGLYAVDAKLLFSLLSNVTADNAQGEFYLTDIVAGAVTEGAGVRVFRAPDAQTIFGINSRAELARVNAIMRPQINARHMTKGVTFVDPDNTYIDMGVTIGADTVIYPGVTLQGKTSIGAGCTLLPGCRIVDSQLGEGVTVKDHSLITGSKLDGGNSVGPHAHLRPETHLAQGAKVGNYVEIKKADIGENSKVNHLSYVGDAKVGTNVNIGAGTITCNYDGENKHQTVIGDGVFIGSDTQLVAPVKVGKGAVIAAGSTITSDVPAGALGISRVEQKTIKGWVASRKTDPKATKKPPAKKKK